MRIRQLLSFTQRALMEILILIWKMFWRNATAAKAGPSPSDKKAWTTMRTFTTTACGVSATANKKASLKN
jgi:hypothetical protein